MCSMCGFEKMSILYLYDFSCECVYLCVCMCVCVVCSEVLFGRLGQRRGEASKITKSV